MDLRLEQYAFLHYAATYWGEHAIKYVENSNVSDDQRSKLRRSILNYLACNETRTAAVQVEYGKMYGHMDSDYYPKGLTALSVAASFGLTSIVEQLLASGADINARDSYGCTPLNRAARRGHGWTVSEPLSARSSSTHGSFLELSYSKTSFLLIGIDAATERRQRPRSR